MSLGFNWSIRQIAKGLPPLVFGGFSRHLNGLDERGSAAYVQPGRAERKVPLNRGRVKGKREKIAAGREGLALTGKYRGFEVAVFERAIALEVGA
jgi:hypothetical protein